MTMSMKQGLLTWSPSDPYFLSRSSISSLKARKTLKPTPSFFKNFVSINDPHRNASNIITYLRKDSENGGSQLKIPTTFDLKEMILLSRLPVAVIVVNAIMFDKPLEVLAETCKADNSVFDMNMPLLLFVAIVGATVGGLVARKRKEELKQLNEQLRQINTSLRRQAKIESYAPSLSYVPVNGRITEDEVIVDPRKPNLISHLKNGKKFLRSQEPEKAFTEFKTALQLARNLADPIEEKKAARGVGAFTEFKTALQLARNLADPIEEKKAARGVGASLQRQGKFRDAIKYHSMVLEISQREGEESGSTEAYGAIADCYTELGDLERAAKYYDQYISRLQSD